MSDLIKAAEELRKVGRAVGKIAFDDLAAGLEVAHSIVQAKNEQARALENIKAEIESAKDDLAKVKAQYKKAAADAQERFDNEVKIHAGIHAQSIAKAQEEASAIIAEANSKRDAIAEQIDIAQREHSALIEKIRAAELNLALINSNIEKVKQEAARLLGN